MDFSRRNVIVNHEARQALVITCSEPTEFGRVVEEPKENSVTRYYVDRVYRIVEQEGKYEYWFLPRIEETLYTTDSIARESIRSLEFQLAQTDEVAIELYEAQIANEEINAAQDDALIELYEMIGG